MRKIVLDTSVIVAALRSRNGASSAIINRIAHRQVVPLVTTPLFLEYEAVLKRPEHQLATGKSVKQIDNFLSAFASAAIGVHTHFRWRPQLRDSDDEMVLEAAANGGAQALVTHNIKDFGMTHEIFGIVVVTPGQYIQDNQNE